MADELHDPTEGPRAVMAAELTRLQGQAAAWRGLGALLSMAALSIPAWAVLAFLAVLR